MKILIPTSFNKNPYIFQLVRALQINREVSTVHTLVPWFFQDEHIFDIVHLQWPESIIPKKNFNPANISFFKERLQFWKSQGSRIVITVHNEIPHRDRSRVSHDLYSTVYQYCDGIVHMGESSRRVLNKSFKLDLNKTREIIIRHGNYDCFPNFVSREEARIALNIPEDQLVVTSIDSIRSKGEYELLKSVSRTLKKRDGLLLQIGNINPGLNTIRKHIRRKLLILRNNIRHCGLYVEDHKMQYYLNACDILLVPRINNLNSGNVALGFTFGKVVLGQDSGVIGEELQQQKNPVFHDNSQKSVEKAMEQAIGLLKTDIGENNRRYALQELNWTVLTKQYMDFYKELSSEPQSTHPNILLEE